MRHTFLSVVVVWMAATPAHAQQGQGQPVPPPPPGGVVVVEHAPQPGSQPVYQVPTQPNQPRLRRHREPYVEGMAIPVGATITRRVRVGLIIPGSLMFAVPYLSTALTYSFLKGVRSEDRQPQGVVLVPVLGPFLAIPNLDSNFEDMGRDSGTRPFFLVFNGLVQLAGLTMLILGAVPKKYVEYYASAPVRVTPTFTAGGGGLELVALF
ncbi:MAG: hypothetical protein AAGH15_25415 [Myxococcota bacterium]